MSDLQPISNIIPGTFTPTAHPADEFDKDFVIRSIRSLGIKGDFSVRPAITSGEWHTYRVTFRNQKGEPAEKVALVAKSNLFTVISTGSGVMELGPANMTAESLDEARRQSPPDLASDEAAVLRRVTGYIRLKLSGLHAGLMGGVQPAPALGVYSVTMVNKISRSLISQLIPASGLIFVSTSDEDPYTMRVRIPDDMYASLGIKPVVDQSPADDEPEAADESSAGDVPAANSPSDEELEKAESILQEMNLSIPAETAIAFANELAEACPPAVDSALKNVAYIHVNTPSRGYGLDDGSADLKWLYPDNPAWFEVSQAISGLDWRNAGLDGVGDILYARSKSAETQPSVLSPQSSSSQPGDGLPASDPTADIGTLLDEPLKEAKIDDLGDLTDETGDFVPLLDDEHQLAHVQIELDNERALRQGNLKQIETLDETIAEMHFAHAAEVERLQHDLNNANMLNQLQSNLLREATAPQPSAEYPVAFWFTTVITLGSSVFEDDELGKLLQTHDALFPATNHDVPGQIVFSAYMVRKPLPPTAPQPEAAAAATVPASEPFVQPIGAPITYIIPPQPAEAFTNSLTGQIASGKPLDDIKSEMNQQAVDQANQTMRGFADLHRSNRQPFTSVGVHSL